MIDIHCHILPGVDDGPSSLEEAAAMCRTAALDGIKTIVATPHCRARAEGFDTEAINGKIMQLQSVLDAESIGVRILPGAEIMLSPELPELLHAGDDFTINRNGKYFLVEFPPFAVPSGWDSFLLSILRSGKTPIIAHPERNAWFMSRPDALASAAGHGILIQITALSLESGFGPAVRDFCVYLLRRDLVHVVASDAHSASARPPRMSKAVELAADLVGHEKALSLTTSAPLAIIEGRQVPVAESAPPSRASRVRKSNWFQRLFG